MKQFPSVLALSLALASGAAFAANTAKPTAAAPPMDHSKMDMSHGQMDHSKMGMSGKTPADRQRMLDEKFAAIDENKDGSLSKAEFTKHHQMMMSMDHGKMPMDHGKMAMDHGKMAMDHGKMSAGHQKMASDEFASLDKNRDGKLVKSEIPAAHPLARHFGMLDANKDGNVSLAEFTRHHGM